MTAEQLEAARAERMRQNGHGAITIEDVRTWIEETGLCIFLPRSAQAGFTAPTFVEAVAGQRTTEPNLELIASAESLLVRLEAEGVAVRLNLSGQPGDQPDYVVAGWVLPYIYALRGDRDWRRSPQLTGSRQVSQLAVQAAKQLDTANLNAGQIRDLLGREVTETAVLRALHELWKQLRIIPVVPEVGTPALWQPLRQRFQKAIAEGASTSQVTAISVLASIYLQAVIAASMEDVEMFLSPLTSRSKIREVVRGLAATRQVHSTTMGHSPMFYVAGTLPEFPAVPSFQMSTSFPPYRGSSYLGTDPDQSHDDDFEPSGYAARYSSSHSAHQSTKQVEAEPVTVSLEADSFAESFSESFTEPVFASEAIAEPAAEVAALSADEAKALRRKQPLVARPDRPAAVRPAASRPAVRITPQPASKSSAAPRPRTAAAAHPRERSHAAAGSRNGSRSASGSGATSNGNGSARRSSASASGSRNGSFSNGNGHAAKPASNGSRNGNGLSSSSASRPRPAGSARPANGFKSGAASTNGARTNGAKSSNGGNGTNGTNGARGAIGTSGTNGASNGSRKPATVSAAKRYSFSGQPKQAPKPAAARTGSAQAAKPAAAGRTSARPASARPASARPSAARPSAARPSSARPANRPSARPAEAKRRG